jgi:replicative DNA helicase
VMASIERLEAQVEHPGALIGLSTGFIELDRITGGLRNGDMIVIAARPSMGKTSIAMNIAEHVAINEQLAVGIFSLEMGADQLSDRLICSRARVNLQKVRDGFLSERDYPALTAAAAKIAEAKLYIDDESGLAVEKITARARRLKQEKNVALIIVDYLQLAGTLTKFKDRQPQVAYQSATFKNLAKDLRIPLIVIAQLNRDPEKRVGGRPRMSDLRESGAIEADADVIALLHRPEDYEEDEEARMEMAGEADLIIAKQRSGPTGEIPLTFLREFVRFEDRARIYQEPEN